MNAENTTFIQSVGKASLTKILMMGLNLVVYAVALKKLGIEFALLHASVLLFMNVFKAGCSFHAISFGRGAFDYFAPDFLLRALLSSTWVFFISVSTSTSFFLLSVLGLPIAIIWLKAFDSHIAGNFLGSVTLSGTSVITSLLVALSVSFGMSELGFLVPRSIVLLVTLGLLLCCGFYFLYEKKMNVLSELMNSSISPLLLILIATLELGQYEWAYILFFKGCEALSQLITFVLLSIRNREQVMLTKRVSWDMFFLLGFVSLSVIYYVRDYEFITLLGIWTIFHAISAYYFVKNYKIAYFFYIGMSFSIIYIGSSWLSEYMVFVLSAQVVSWFVLRHKYISGKLGGFEERV